MKEKVRTRVIIAFNRGVVDGITYVYPAWRIQTQGRGPDIDFGAYATLKKAREVRRKRFKRDNRGYYFEE